eukprot:3351465-Rhodomonas_salina.2
MPPRIAVPASPARATHVVSTVFLRGALSLHRCASVTRPCAELESSQRGSGHTSESHDGLGQPGSSASNVSTDWRSSESGGRHSRCETR